MKKLVNINRLVQSIVYQISHPSAIKVFRTVLYIFLLINTLILLPEYKQFWGEHTYIWSALEDDSNLLFQFLNLLSSPGLSHLYPWFIAAQIVFLLIGMTGRLPVLSAMVVYFTTLNLDNKAWAILNGGNNLIHIQMVFLMLMEIGVYFSNRFQSGPEGPKNSQMVFNTLANLSFYSARLQLVMVYTVAGITKVKGTLWVHGVALYYVLNSEAYSHPLATQYLASSDLMVMAGTYFTLLFQLGFPWLVWFRSTRSLFLTAGTFLHMQIAFVMGLLDFGFAMSIMYLLFLTEKRAKSIVRYWSPKTAIHVAFDENCKVCIGFARLVKALDFRNLIVQDSAQTPMNTFIRGVDVQTRLSTMIAYVDNKQYSGFESILEIFRRIPVFKPLLPILCLIQVLGFGRILYGWVSKSMPSRRKCLEGLCALDRSSDANAPKPRDL